MQMTSAYTRNSGDNNCVILNDWYVTTLKILILGSTSKPNYIILHWYNV